MKNPGKSGIGGGRSSSASSANGSGRDSGWGVGGRWGRLLVSRDSSVSILSGYAGCFKVKNPVFQFGQSKFCIRSDTLSSPSGAGKLSGKQSKKKQYHSMGGGNDDFLGLSKPQIERVEVYNIKNPVMIEGGGAKATAKKRASRKGRRGS